MSSPAPAKVLCHVLVVDLSDVGEEPSVVFLRDSSLDGSLYSLCVSNGGGSYLDAIATAAVGGGDHPDYKGLRMRDEDDNGDADYDCPRLPKDLVLSRCDLGSLDWKREQSHYEIASLHYYHFSIAPDSDSEYEEEEGEDEAGTEH